MPIGQFEGRRQGPRAHHRNNDVALAPLLFASVKVPPPGVYGPARGQLGSIREDPAAGAYLAVDFGQ
ncbi:hypothetical protein [Corynebacterium argentoratense]|uniref:hypothetical protein n=1 Tax=Corynebacterium argentoratense TaxID=42817 RepID=UPI00128CA7E8|nr:hypothetical protein [Corynebacterium argentoratense]